MSAAAPPVGDRLRGAFEAGKADRFADLYAEDARPEASVPMWAELWGERDDPEANALIGLVGLVMYGWIFGHSAVYHPDPAERAWATSELSWWVPEARRGLEALGG